LTGPDGLGVAVKAEDGGFRALRPAVSFVLGRLGHDLDGRFSRPAIRNSHGEEVGELAATGA
jgi:L-asparaginase II